MITNGAFASHSYESLAAVLGLVRSGRATTRPQILRATDLGRTAVNQRIEEAVELGLLEDAQFGPSTGGRMPRNLEIRSSTAYIAGAVFGVTRFHVAIATLDGRIVDQEAGRWNIRSGPGASVEMVAETVSRLMAPLTDAPLWGMSIGLPIPVDYGTGSPLLDRNLPDWGRFPVRERLEARFGVPVWVDTDVNLMAYGEWRNASETFGDELVLVKCGTSISAGLVADGKPYRGARSVAGRIGHLRADDSSTARCTCGKTGCLEAMASGWAIAAAAQGRPIDAEGRWSHDGITIDDVVDAAIGGDSAAQTRLSDAAAVIGAALADVVTFYNPSALVIAGSMTRWAPFIDHVRPAVFHAGYALALDGLHVSGSLAGHSEGIMGALALTVDELLSAGQLARWAPAGSPEGMSAH